MYSFLVGSEYEFFDERASAVLSSIFAVDLSHIIEWRACVVVSPRS
jgi:hypothetical protein